MTKIITNIIEVLIARGKFAWFVRSNNVGVRGLCHARPEILSITCLVASLPRWTWDKGLLT